jgi:hypothetical protein
MSAEITYKTHILIGVPRQSDVQDRMNDARNGYVSFALCTPTSIIPAASNGGHSSRSNRYGVGI